MTLIQIDAHIDWRDHVNGVRDGLSSPIRRASEMSHIGEIYQIGIRAQGSARPEEVEAARAYGPTSSRPSRCTMPASTRSSTDPRRRPLLPHHRPDGMDPSVMPRSSPAPGGLTFHQRAS